MEECYLNPPTLPKVTFRYGCFYFFKIVQMVQNRAKHHICFWDQGDVLNSINISDGVYYKRDI